MPIRRADAHDRDREHGQSLAEFAVILPFMLFLILGGIELARLFTMQVSLANGAREGAALGAVLPNCPDQAPGRPILCRDPDNVEWRVRNEAGSASAVTVATTCTGSCGPGDYLTVTVNGVYRPLFPFVPTVALGTGATSRIVNPGIVADGAAPPQPTASPTASPTPPPTPTPTPTRTSDPLETLDPSATPGSTPRPTPTPCPEVKVINVVGSNKNVAITALGGAGLVIDAVEVPKRQGLGANQVVFQDPGENASVCRGSSITIKYTSPN